MITFLSNSYTQDHQPIIKEYWISSVIFRILIESSLTLIIQGFSLSKLNDHKCVAGTQGQDFNVIPHDDDRVPGSPPADVTMVYENYAVTIHNPVICCFYSLFYLRDTLWAATQNMLYLMIVHRRVVWHRIFVTIITKWIIMLSHYVLHRRRSL